MPGLPSLDLDDEVAPDQGLALPAPPSASASRGSCDGGSGAGRPALEQLVAAAAAAAGAAEGVTHERRAAGTL
jgi:hypothetical protein